MVRVRELVFLLILKQLMESKLTAHMSTNIMCFGPITTLPLNEQKKKQLPNKNKKAKIT